jgi:outer membrane protein TolC
MWAVLGLVTPAPSAAQAPPGPSVTATQQFTTPQGGTLSLSLDEAVARALENNADIAVERFNPELSAQDVRGAEGYYDPFLFATLTKSSTDTKGTNLFSGGATVNTKTDLWNFGVQQEIQTGASLSVGFNNNKRDTNNVFSTFNPVYNSNLSFNLTQPLLKNFGIDAPRLNLKILKKSREITDVQFRQTVINTVAVVKGYYYELLYAIDNLTAAQKNLDLAKKLLEENEIRVRVGTMAPLDVVTAQSEVARREEGVIVAENALAEADDNLKRVIFPQNDPMMWSTRLAPTDRPSAEPMPVDIEAAVRNAIENRTDMVSARKALEQRDYNLSYRRNQLRPQLDLIATYGGSGADGTQVRDAEGNPLPAPLPGGYGDAVSEVFGFDFPTWTVGFNVSYAIPNRSAKANAAAAQLEKDQALASYRRLELQVAAEVRTAARGVESGFKRVASSQAARRLAAERLDAEEKKFAAGMSTNFFVTQAQRDLAEAEVSELRAIADYRKSVINYQRVQEAGVSGSGAAVVLSGSSAGSAQAGQALLSGAAGSSNQF